MHRYKVLIYAEKPVSPAAGQRSGPHAEKKVFPYEIEATDEREAKLQAMQRFVRDHSVLGDGWLTNEVEILRMDM